MMVAYRLAGALLFLVFVGLTGCRERKDEEPLFEALGSERTLLNFNNELFPTKELNIMTYLYYFNGGGVGTGDFNKDGLVDIFFSGNLKPSRLYINQGDLTFKDVTNEAGIDDGGHWSTGVSVIDINNDGLLDIYLNQLGGFRDFAGRNRLFVCTGIRDGVPVFEERAAVYQLDLVGLATQSLFFDYDRDNDLDMYQMNHSVHENGTFGERKTFLGKAHDKAGDKFFRNDNGKFTDVTQESGIHSMVIGYGLGIAASDVNNDGWPDIYIGNDFHENDYLYINQRDGTFKECLTSMMTNTSRFSMGVDIADINNDQHADVISLDMQPYDPIVLKSSLGEDEYSSFLFKLTYGYNVQFARNNLQLNNGDGTFSEIGMYSRVHATDWSWAALFLDFDNDGLKDLFVSNGIPARMNDIDYVNFRSENEDHRWKTQGNRMDFDDLEIIKRIPEIKFPNKFFRNSGGLKFDEMEVRNSPGTFSNGASYADFDNDGDLDVVVNNINDGATLYRNLANDRKEKRDFLSVTFDGPAGNKGGIGSKVVVFKDKETITYENWSVRGFQSSMTGKLHIGLGDSAHVDSLIVIWPDGKFQRLNSVSLNKELAVQWKENLKSFDFTSLQKRAEKRFKDITAESGLDFVHKENPFIEFDRERLIPFMTSTQGPAAAVGDLNGDGLDDIFFGSSKWEASRIYLQQIGGIFKESDQPGIAIDSTYEDVDAVIVDIDNDGDNDLIVASGGNEFWGDSPWLKQRYYINDGHGNFVTKGFFPNASVTASCVVANDFDNDGFVDVFIGGRAIPKSYGQIPKSYLFKNLGNGKFADVTEEHIPALTNIGMVTSAAWTDANEDDVADLVLAIEWGEVKAFLNLNGVFKESVLFRGHGLWNLVYPTDYDSDGDIDFILGNSGRNTKFAPSISEPLRLYLNDFDDNGQVEQVLTYYIEGRELPFATHAELTKQLPYLKKKFLFARDFARASLDDLFGEKLSTARLYEVNTMANALLVNHGNMQFEHRELPFPLQLSSVRAACALSNSESLLLGGNFFENHIDMGWYNANYVNEMTSENGALTVRDGSLGVRGQVRKILSMVVAGKQAVLFVRNNDRALLFEPVAKELALIENQ